ncbi:MAG: geranylgeranylglyceryl/heptaprenylglyceryl phosphate synthase [Bacteroidetes bacterium GWA2_31_9]|nr:MAG: geranylgeranylglyceryl/heptaprenylglyceryl phosphate synthase [Bacteroidetes bacterium GWA2_31_9]
MNIYKLITDKVANKKKIIAALIDPDKISKLPQLIKNIESSRIDLILIGGSLLFTDIEKTIKLIKSNTKKPVLIFPGNILQVSDKADGILLLSLISGRNPDLLIGNHVISAPIIKKANIEVIPTGYMLIESGKKTSVEYISNTKPIPNDKSDIATATAMAGEMLGLKLIYLEAGSGAANHVPLEMIKKVKNNISLPLIVGGGFRNIENIKNAFKSGADIIVLGSILEDNIDFIEELGVVY